MKYPVRRFKSLLLALKEIEPFVRNGAHLQTGRSFGQLDGLRSREILANLLLCITVKEIDGRDITFSSDPLGGDGIIEDLETGETWPTEHVLVTDRAGDQHMTIETRILRAIERKRQKGGDAYAGGKTLVVFLEVKAAQWLPNAVARSLPDPLHFAAVWVVALHGVDEGCYLYHTALLDVSHGAAPAFLVRIAEVFDGWQVARIQ